ncbi:MAG: hypothetical protein IKL85_07565 [Lentisphaeria bacterium]|nr:hypothetical protein [Lentisphaeria bacterium]
MENEKLIAVYFSNGKRAVFRESEIALSTRQEVPDFLPQGKTTVINWNNVCFCREFKEEDDDA